MNTLIGGGAGQVLSGQFTLTVKDTYKLTRRLAEGG